ncbi:hypothetical protein SAMN05216570_0132 [Dyella sp. OK004]|uniref:hypothetical protein n=1 Tax=Dyella sp. OK004 TaxID=1855292 RepID=UPI0008DF7000|nr:hypothetical protein [Dyella sp. OK004]SFR86738.1 hypothetical protein SAMN05216570_0132 [Dyella sp. OK004]
MDNRACAGGVPELGAVGLKITHGLLGSEEWWDNIWNKELPTQVLQGTIAQFWTGRAGDFPEVEVIDADGEHSRWLLQIETSVAQCELKVGSAIEISYVNQEFKSAFNGRSMNPFVLMVRAEDRRATFAG